MILSKLTMFLFLMIFVFCGVSMGEVYKVGDSTGWTHNGHIDYKSWSSNKNFHVGDSIVFEYKQHMDNVVRVTHKNFNTCNATTTYATFNTGNDTFVIKRPGHFYFISSFPGHCQNGQRVDIRVPRPTKSSPSPSPSPTPPRAPSSSSSPPPTEPITPSSTQAPAPSPSGSSEMLFSIKLWLSMLLIVVVAIV
ncbi:mavicyanin-like [Solanum stenotomum]|uniref:mavicyanin-like n=1 Tax=Solanum stenotomum TaxID=172797 RepID=UPI0020D013E9|nr:mavicyanin-like [Solanum stenotomum]